MIQKTFFCIRPYIFEKREIIKQMIRDNGLKIISSKIVWLTTPDIRIIYGHEEPSVYFNACLHYMRQGFSEAGIIEDEDAIQRLVDLVSPSHIPSDSGGHTIRAIFGKSNPIDYNGFNYYLNPIHRSRTEEEANREVKHYYNVIFSKTPTENISDMMRKLHKDKNLLCVYNHHIKLVVDIALDLQAEFGGNKTVIELAAWLHDIASLATGSKHEHHIEGATMAEDILKLFNYSKDIINQIKHCIQTHRGNYPLQKMTKEAEIVCSADAIANMKYAPLLFYFAYNIKNLNFEDGYNKVNDKVESSYKKVVEWIKPKAKIYYDHWKKIL